MAPRVQLANLYFDAERFQDAAEWYEAALKINPRDVNASTDLGIAYYYMNQPDKRARTIRPLARDRSESREDAVERRHRSRVRRNRISTARPPRGRRCCRWRPIPRRRGPRVRRSTACAPRTRASAVEPPSDMLASAARLHPGHHRLCEPSVACCTALPRESQHHVRRRQARRRSCAIRSAEPMSSPSRALTSGSRHGHALLLLRAMP